jgi:hypothetical protein
VVHGTSYINISSVGRVQEHVVKSHRPNGLFTKACGPCHRSGSNLNTEFRGWLHGGGWPAAAYQTAIPATPPISHALLVDDRMSQAHVLQSKLHQGVIVQSTSIGCIDSYRLGRVGKTGPRSLTGIRAYLTVVRVSKQSCMLSRGDSLLH